MRGAGGTPGGLGGFFAGLAMVVAGGYLLLTRVTVTSACGTSGATTRSVSRWSPSSSASVSSSSTAARSPGGCSTAGGALIILVGIIANLQIYFRATSLFDTLVILILLAGGLGLVARSLRPQDPAAAGSYPAAE